MDDCTVMSLDRALEQLEEVAPDVPFLALGQTVFWDEPMKAGVALRSKRLGYSRPFVAGVHDTDYFAKLPSGPRQPGKFAALPHNDTSTQGLWSAAGEFSCLFGSETVVTRHDLHDGGLRLDRLVRKRPGFLDEATEAWGWRGIVSLDDNPPVSAELPLHGVFPVLKSTLDWALEESLSCLVGEGGGTSRKLAEELEARMCDAYDELASTRSNPTLAELYRQLIPDIYSFVANAEVDLEATTTTELLKFNRESAGKPRFEVVDLFLGPETRSVACACYDEVVQGTGLYDLNRFGTGSLPFDLVIPGKGRGTLRVTKRAVIVMTPQPVFITLKKPISTVHELAAAIESKLGSNCVLVGKAVALIGMLAKEFVFVFHEGASSYVKHSRRLHRCLEENLKVQLRLHPILRVRYRIWDALQVCCSWIRLPAPLQGPFGTVELCAPSIGHRWHEVSKRQESMLKRLGELRRPLDLLNYLESELGGSWKRLAEEYEQLHDELEASTKELQHMRSKRISLYERKRGLRRDRVAVEHEMGEHFRSRIFEKEPAPSDLAARAEFQQKRDRIVTETVANQGAIRGLMHHERELARSEEVMKIHERRRSIELEAELARLRLIRGAVMASKGLQRASFRPSAWWFRLVCPDGLWFRETIESAECYLEPLI